VILSQPAGSTGLEAGYGGGYDSGMTRKLTISVPDDVADHLDRVENVSGYLTALARRDMRREVGLRQLKDAGFAPTAQGVETMRARVAAARARIAAKRAAG
jgi:hypothetical protein